MAYVFREDQAPYIPYAGLAPELFSETRTQKLVPFLGAGASLSSRAREMPEPASCPAIATQLESLATTLGLQSDAAQLLLQIACAVACRLDALERETTQNRPEDPVGQAKRGLSPPSAAELAAALAAVSNYDHFEPAASAVERLLSGSLPARNDPVLRRALHGLVSLTGIATPTPPLVAVASYLQYTLKRAKLFEVLREIFATRRDPTVTHELVAEAADFHFRQDPLTDYLIITTNYDCLMEAALDRELVPYCVLAVDKRDRKVYTRFSPHVREYLRMDQPAFSNLIEEHKGKSYPSSFFLQRSRPLAIVYKIHGCLAPESTAPDSLVISDDDYVDYIYWMGDNQGTVPAVVTPLIAKKAFLFLGYSFSDWNVRSVYRRIVERRTAPDDLADYSVMRDVSAYERGFFNSSSINILQTDLASFATGIRRYTPRPAGPRVDTSGDRQPV